MLLGCESAQTVALGRQRQDGQGPDNSPNAGKVQVGSLRPGGALHSGRPAKEGSRGVPLVSAVVQDPSEIQRPNGDNECEWEESRDQSLMSSMIELILCLELINLSYNIIIKMAEDKQKNYKNWEVRQIFPITKIVMRKKPLP